MNAKRPKWFKSFLVKYRRSVIFALVLGLAASGCAALLMFTSGYLISATAIRVRKACSTLSRTSHQPRLGSQDHL